MLCRDGNLTCSLGCCCPLLALTVSRNRDFPKENPASLGPFPRRDSCKLVPGWPVPHEHSMASSPPPPHYLLPAHPGASFCEFQCPFQTFPELSHIERKMSHPGDAPRVGLSKMCLLRVCRMTAHPVQHRAPCVQQLPNGFKSHLVAYCGVSGWKLSTRELRGSRAAPAFLLMECRKRSVWFCFGFFFPPEICSAYLAGHGVEHREPGHKQPRLCSPDSSACSVLQVCTVPLQLGDGGSPRQCQLCFPLMLFQSGMENSIVGY